MWALLRRLLRFTEYYLHSGLPPITINEAAGFKRRSVDLWVIQRVVKKMAIHQFVLNLIIHRPETIIIIILMIIK